ncbi:MAG: hypothetical protein K6A33_13195 [Clostridiales bacterium]|nr:hypothetical protein [Clostridiales bacterium]
MERFTAALLAALFLAATLTGCFRIQKIDPAKTPETPETEPGNDVGIALPPEEIPVNFDLDLLIAENSISTLLEWNDSVTVRRDYDGGSEIESFWKYDGDRVYITESVTDDGSSSMAGSFRGLDFYVYEQDWTTATKWITAQPEVYDSWIDSTINRFFPTELSEDIVITEEDADNYTVCLYEEIDLGDGRTTPCVNTAVVNKGTLFLQSFAWEYVDGDTRYYGSFEVEYNGERLGTDVMEDWEGFREINLDILTEAGARTENFFFPERWQLRCLPDEGIILSSPDGMEEEGTILIGANTGYAEVFARDEANLLASETGGGESEALPFPLDEVIERNRITNLLKAYPTVSMTLGAEGGEQKTSFFRRGDDIVEVEEMSYLFDDTLYSYTSGSCGDNHFEIDSEGNASIAVEIPDPEGEDYFFTDEDGEYYGSDYALTSSLLLADFGTISDVEESGDTVSFRITFDYGDGITDGSDYVIDRETLLIRSIGYDMEGMTAEIEYGGEVPFADVLDEAYAETRDIFVHYEDVGEVHYEVPAAWAFSVGYFDEVGCWEDDGFHTPLEMPIPGDGENYEFWVTRGVG